MGKTTLYHPLPLTVIRGAAEYCGFRFGRITQYYADKPNGCAIYNATITQMPGDLEQTGSLLRIHHDLQECFMDDVRIHWVHVTQGGLWNCRITVTLKRDKEPFVELIPNPEPSIEPIPVKNGKGR